MDRRYVLKEYIKLLTQNNKDIEPYYNLLGDISLYDTIYETEMFIARLLNIREDIKDYVIDEWAIEHIVLDENNNPIETLDELVDFILKLEEEDK